MKYKERNKDIVAEFRFHDDMEPEVIKRNVFVSMATCTRGFR
jgi:hypothetical protein